MTDVFEKQVGGDHYKNLSIQPVQVAYSIGATPMWLTVCKYITRVKDNREEDLQKALHCIELENGMFELRCSKYIAELAPYEHTDIKAFANQFEDKDFVYNTLHSLYFGYYKQAAELILKEVGDAE